MGATIIAGAVTTAGSGASMFPGIVQFFYKMALLIVLTICFSLSYALLFFMPLVLVAGPDRGKGDISQSGCVVREANDKINESNDDKDEEEVQQEELKSTEMVMYKEADKNGKEHEI